MLGVVVVLHSLTTRLFFFLVGRIILLTRLGAVDYLYLTASCLFSMSTVVVVLDVNGSAVCYIFTTSLEDLGT